MMQKFLSMSIENLKILSFYRSKRKLKVYAAHVKIKQNLRSIVKLAKMAGIKLKKRFCFNQLCKSTRSTRKSTRSTCLCGTVYGPKFDHRTRERPRSLPLTKNCLCVHYKPGIKADIKLKLNLAPKTRRSFRYRLREDRR